jgi:hypothetical protein
MLKLAFKVLAALVLLALAAPFVAAMWLQSYVSPEYLVRVTEQSCNCRAQLDSTSLTLFSWPPTLRLNGIKIAPRDEYSGTPLQGRPPLENAPVQVSLAYAELLSDDILHGRMTPNLVRFVGVEVQETLDPQTGSSLEKLFLPPTSPEALAAAEEAPRAIPVAEVAPTPDAGAPRTYPVTNPPPVVESRVEVAPAARPGRIPLREIRLEEAHFHITNKAVDAQIDADIRDFEFVMSSIDVDPEDLANHNHMKASLKAKVTVKGVAKVQGQMRPVQFADVTLQGQGDIVPLEPTTVTWKPSATLSLAFARGSTIGGHMTLGDAAGDKLDKLKEHGIDLSAVRLGGTLTEDATANIFYDREALFFRSPTRIAMPDFEFTVKQDAWINVTRDAQFMPVRVVFGPAIREPLVQGIAAKGLGDTITRGIISMISDERGNPFIDLVITGSLSKPEVQHELIGKIEKLFRGSGIKDLLKDENVGNLLQGLFKKIK